MTFELSADRIQALFTGPRAEEIARQFLATYFQSAMLVRPGEFVISRTLNDQGCWVHVTGVLGGWLQRAPVRHCPRCGSQLQYGKCLADGCMWVDRE